MIDIYTEKKNSKNWILKNDLYFNLNTTNEEMSEKEVNRIALNSEYMAELLKDGSFS